jgi:3-(3-hydroxy-phenyl)propionate hydroxylase
MRSFVHDRVLFVSDAAYLVSPFGARGANGGIQDVDNLGWKLAAEPRAEAGPALLASYDEERIHAADENLCNSIRATDFMTPKSAPAAALQAGVLELAAEHPFARALVNSGRLSVSCSLAGSSLVSPDSDGFDTAGFGPGTVALDAPISREGSPGWLLDSLGPGSTCLAIGISPPPAALPPGVRACVVGRDLVDSEGLLTTRYDAQPGAIYLLRPDQHLAARWRCCDLAREHAAWRRSLGFVE